MEDTKEAASTPSSTEINVVGDGGFDMQTLAALTADEGDTAEELAAPTELERNEEIPKEIFEKDEEEVASDEQRDEGEAEASEGEAQEPASDVEKIAVNFGGKEYEVPKDAEVSIQVNGKKEKITIQEALNRASGALHIERETSSLGRKKAELEKIETAHREKVQKIEADLTALRELEDPYEICEYVAALQGKDSAKIFEEMVRKTADFLERRSRMTPEQIEIERENRRLKLWVKQRETQEKQQQERQTQAQKQEALKQELESYGFSNEDFVNAIEEIREKLSAGEELDLGLDKDEPITKDTIIDYLLRNDLNNRLETAVSSVNSQAKSDPKIMEKLFDAVVQAESLRGKFTEADLKKFVTAALAQEKKATSESLSRKAQLRPKSQPANSLGQDEDDDGLDVLDINEYYRTVFR